MAEHNIAGAAEDDGLGVAKYGGDLEASGALDVHEEAIGGLHEALELVCVGLGLGGGVEQIDRHFIDENWLCMEGNPESTKNEPDAVGIEEEC